VRIALSVITICLAWRQSTYSYRLNRAIGRVGISFSRNLRTLSTAELAQERYSEILTENTDSPILGDPGDSAKCEEQMRFANDLAQKELGGIYELVEAGEASTFDGLSKELDIQERLDAAISRCLKRLLFVRGIKSISETSLPTSPPKRIADPSRAA
jgi:hypothetical protein